MKLEFLDTTLRDGAQAEGISFSTADKASILHLLDDFGIDLIEGGEPSANPKDEDFFRLEKCDKLVAFGSTRHGNSKASEDANLKKLIDANTSTVCIFGKSSVSQVENVLGVTLAQNIEMIEDSVKFLKSAGKRVIFDAEHFFDGFKENPKFALKTLLTAYGAGAGTLVLCDTNGGTSPDDIFSITKSITDAIPEVSVGIHTHNDTGVAVASSIAAVKAGATHIQGTFLGFGERCGNANLSTIIANLALKEHSDLAVNLLDLTKVARTIAEIANITLDPSMPYVGSAAFAHKAGMHSDAVAKNPQSFEHISPSLVGNKHHILLSEMAGRATVAKKLENILPALNKSNPKTKEILDAIKEMEMRGYEFEGADGSFVLLAERIIDKFKPSFVLDHYTISATKPEGVNSAEVSIKVDGRLTTVCENGNGPVNAIDKALRHALQEFFPQIAEVSLVDYKVRVVNSASATGAVVRVLITSRDKTHTWTTVGVSSDIIEASWLALVDSLEYKLNILT